MRPINFKRMCILENGAPIAGIMLQHNAMTGVVHMIGIGQGGGPMSDSFAMTDDPETLREMATALEEQAAYVERVRETALRRPSGEIVHDTKGPVMARPKKGSQ